MMMNYYLLTMVMIATAVGGIEPHTYGWDFGYGQQSGEQSPAPAYENSGTYQVIPNVTDSIGQSPSYISQVIVPPPPLPIFSCKGQTATIFGTPYSDVIVGTSGRDVIAALGGDDEVRGGGGDDLICGHEGSDRLIAYAGNDYMYGGAGNDYMEGGAGHNWMFGDDGNDEMYGGSGIDVMIGGDDNDRMNGGFGGDPMYGDDGVDTMYGHYDSDYMDGGSGSDYMYGGHGEDQMWGEKPSIFRPPIGPPINVYNSIDAGNDRLDGGGRFDHGDGGPKLDECLNLETEINCESTDVSEKPPPDAG